MTLIDETGVMADTFTARHLAVVGTPEQPEQVPEDRQSRLDSLRALLVDTDGLDSLPEPVPLIPGVMFRDSLTWIFGEPGCGKSFMSIDIAGCIATGQSWQGFEATEAGPVVYLVAEGASGIKRRVRAWEASMKTRMRGVHFLPVPVQAGNDAQWTALIDLCAEIRPALIVLDTQARVTVGMEENSNTDMGKFVEQLERLRRATAACVLTVHHTGRGGEHMRGAIALDGAANTVIKITKSEDIINVECAKQKDAEAFDPFRLRLVKYEDSACLSLIGGPLTVDIGQPAVRRMLAEWWNSYETDWVSVKMLEDSKIVTRATFYRNAKALVKQGYLETKGDGNARRYSLLKKVEL